MRRESYQQYAIVKSDSARTFTDQLNAELRRLAEKKPVVTFTDADPYLARISYIETEIIPESIRDEYRLEGVDFCCEDCPMFKPIMKTDGTEDRRVKYGGCRYAEFGRTYRTSAACEHLFRMMRSGEVKLCLAESE